MGWESLAWTAIHYYARHIVAAAHNDSWAVLLKARYYSAKFMIVVLLKQANTFYYVDVLFKEQIAGLWLCFIFLCVSGPLGLHAGEYF